MKISITYLYPIFKYGYPHSVDDALRALPEIRRLGFRYLEMEGLGPENMSTIYRRQKELLSALSDNGLHVHNFCVVDPNLVSLDPGVRRCALEGFRLGAELAAALGSETLHLASYAPPVEHARRPYQLSSDHGYEFVDVTQVRLPKGFRWSEVWDALVDSCRECADIAREHGKTVLIEPRVGEVVCSVDSLLRLLEHAQRPNLKANFDTAHFSAQRENVVLALAKLEGQFANIHAADNHPRNADHLPIGDGSIDWREFLATLGRIGYDGYLGLDLGLDEHLVDGYRRSIERLQEIAADLKLPLEV